MKIMLYIFLIASSSISYCQQLGPILYVNSNYVNSITSLNFMGEKAIQDNEVTYIRISNDTIYLGVENSFFEIKLLSNHLDKKTYSVLFASLDSASSVYLNKGIPYDPRNCDYTMTIESDSALITFENRLTKQRNVSRFSRLTSSPFFTHGRYVFIPNYAFQGKYTSTLSKDTIVAENGRLKGFPYDSYSITELETVDPTKPEVIVRKFVCTLTRGVSEEKYLLEYNKDMRSFYTYGLDERRVIINKKLSFTLTHLR